MRWTMGRRSDNVEDRRGSGPGMPLVAGGGIGSIILVLVALYFGIDPSVVLQGGGQPAPTAQAPAASSRGGDDQIKQFVSVVLADTEDTWRQLFRGMNREYRDPTLVLFTGSVQSACGMAGAAVGPFYCPGDQKLYIDLVLLPRPPRPLRRPRRLRPGLRHRPRGRPPRPEPARHLRASVQAAPPPRRHAGSQRALGPHGAPGRLLRRRLGPPRRQRRASVLEQGDVEEALGAATAIGDDRLQKRARGSRRPRKLHPRHLRTARPVVPARLRGRRNPPVRHLRLESPLNSS